MQIQQRYEDVYETQSLLLGQGAFAQVFLGIKKSNKQKVAVKISNRNLAISQKEKSILKQVSQNQHPNVIQILDIFDQNNTLFIVQEYCSGGTLYEMMINKKFNEDQIVNIAIQVAQGLQFLHQHNIVHRDIKPENILRYVEVDGTEVFKITDFGLSSIKSDRMTTTKVGTAYYVAPEIFLDKDGYDKSVDIWALGLIIDELIHGTPFYNGASEDEVFAKIKSDSYVIRDPQYSKATIFDHKKNIIKTLLLNTIQKNPKMRKDLVWILQSLSEYYLQSPISEQNFQVNENRYHFNDVSVFSQPMTCDQTQIFQAPNYSVEVDSNFCTYHHLPIKYRMPGINDEQLTFACQKCLVSYGIIDISEFQGYLSKAYQELQLISLDSMLQQNQLIIEALKYLDQFKLFKEKEKLISELRLIVTKQQKQLKIEYMQYLEDLKTFNVNAKWINDALKFNFPQTQDSPNKLIYYIQQLIQEKRELTLVDCKQFIKEQLINFRENLINLLQ